MKLSIIVPVFNEAPVLAQIDARLSPVLRQLNVPYEVIFVNDASSDESLSVLKKLRELDQSYKIVELSRNFGQQLAITAGLDYGAGDAVIVMDDDLQDPPELIPELVERWREGYDVVCAVRQQRQGGDRDQEAHRDSVLPFVEIPHHRRYPHRCGRVPPP
jgi:dolichol-phosphate mannosyltransferase